MDNTPTQQYGPYIITHIGCGTHREVEYFCDTKPDDIYIDNLTQHIKNIITHFDAQYSRFRPDSLINQYNRGEISADSDTNLKTMLELGEKHKDLTEGIFDIHIGSDLVKLGYGADIYTEQHQTYIDLGGLGKGYLIQLIATYIQEQGIQKFSIDGGGDIYLHQPIGATAQDIYISDPLDSTKYIGKVSLHTGAFANSGTQHRTRGNNHEKHHLIDTQTSQPSNHPYLSVHILHDDIVVADIAATALFVTPLAKFEHIAKVLGVERLLILDDMSTLRSPGFSLQEV